MVSMSSSSPCVNSNSASSCDDEMCMSVVDDEKNEHLCVSLLSMTEFCPVRACIAGIDF